MAINQILLEAIALKKCVTATYNNVQMLLAPHILYSKFDALFVDAIALEKNGEPPKEKKLGAFHLAGLKELALTERHFIPDALFDPAAEKYNDTMLFKVETPEN
jgi:hypothetical protein